jgi:hypothetical protein
MDRAAGKRFAGGDGLVAYINHAGTALGVGVAEFIHSVLS